MIIRHSSVCIFVLQKKVRNTNQKHLMASKLMILSVGKGTKKWMLSYIVDRTVSRFDSPRKQTGNKCIKIFKSLCSLTHFFYLHESILK